ARHARVEDPPMHTVAPFEPVLQGEALPPVHCREIAFDAPLVILRVDTLRPPVPEILLECSSGEVQPRFVEERTECVRTRHPDEYRRGIRHHTEALLALTPRQLRLLAFGDITPHALQLDHLTFRITDGAVHPLLPAQAARWQPGLVLDGENAWMLQQRLNPRTDALARRFVDGFQPPGAQHL